MNWETTQKLTPYNLQTSIAVQEKKASDKLLMKTTTCIADNREKWMMEHK